MLYKYTGCANRSCGSPKPGRRLLNGVRWCRWGSAEGPSVPDQAPEGPWGCSGVPGRSEHQLCTNMGQSSDPLDDYMLRAALAVTHFFLGENRHAPLNFFYFLVTRRTAMPIQLLARFCARWHVRLEKLLHQCQNPSR